LNTAVYVTFDVSKMRFIGADHGAQDE
jgi:hypothetical protein